MQRHHNIAEEIEELEQEVLDLAARESDLMAAAAAQRERQQRASKPTAQVRASKAKLPQRSEETAAGSATAREVLSDEAQLSAATTQLVKQQQALTQLLRTLQSSPQRKRAPPRDRPSSLGLGPELARLRVQAHDSAAAQAQLRAQIDALRRRNAALAEREGQLLAAQQAAAAQREARRAEAAAALLLAHGEQQEAERLAEENAELRKELALVRQDVQRQVAAEQQQRKKAERAQEALQQRVEALTAVLRRLQAEAALHER